MCFLTQHFDSRNQLDSHSTLTYLTTLGWNHLALGKQPVSFSLSAESIRQFPFNDQLSNEELHPESRNLLYFTLGMSGPVASRSYFFHRGKLTRD